MGLHMLRALDPHVPVPDLPGLPSQIQAARQLHMRMWKNSLFYCTTNEIVIGNLNRTGWPPLIQEMAR